MCWAFSLFLLVYEIIPPKVAQWEIFAVPSGDNASQKKYFESRKSTTPFDASISEERFGQISLKSVKSACRINSFVHGEFAQKQKLCFRP